MGTKFEDLRILQGAEEVADGIWQQVTGWNEFPRDVVGKQMARAADSIGANIAEAFGRFHFGEKLQFLYYTRGSLFETKYWLNRALNRELMTAEEGQKYIAQLTALARQLNALAKSTKSQRSGNSKQSKSIQEARGTYEVDYSVNTSTLLFDDDAPGGYKLSETARLKVSLSI